MNCEHNYEFYGNTGHGLRSVNRINPFNGQKYKTTPLTFLFNCAKCKCKEERRATPGEYVFYSSFAKNNSHIHKVWFDFLKKFKKTVKLDNGGTDEKYKYYGYDLIEKVEKWSDKYPDDVKICNVDDSSHSGSILVLIEHKTKSEYFGTTAIMISQCSGSPPVEFFLYPHHRENLISALVKIDKVAKPIAQAQAKATKEMWTTIKKNIKFNPVL